MVSFTPQPLHPRGKSPPTRTHWIGSWVGPRAGLDAVAKKSFFCRWSNPILTEQYSYTNIFIYIYVCVCVCVCFLFLYFFISKCLYVISFRRRVVGVPRSFIFFKLYLHVFSISLSVVKLKNVNLSLWRFDPNPPDHEVNPQRENMTHGMGLVELDRGQMGCEDVGRKWTVTPNC
jgi:hypothetical protein